ncbi:hypothetical protein BB560_006485 [Smittium megazygosporum]|uniref:Cytochrome b5 heme-binding domain-containing protein n=1 Tax=Smittium megazygosporum TaxID=133381 RepID=A0A2T9Y573_9FUNG|nr:hypothetical protein BB560_006485 [Smittium megazygosporum]
MVSFSDFKLDKSSITQIVLLTGVILSAHILYSKLTSSPSGYPLHAKAKNKNGQNKTKSKNKEHVKLTKRQLASYVGKLPLDPIYIAIKGVVYDVSVNGGRRFYGPGGAYSIFAGRDASRLFSRFDFDEGVTQEELDSPIDKLDDLSPEEQDSLDAYIQLFESKYERVGILVDN